MLSQIAAWAGAVLAAGVIIRLVALAAAAAGVHRRPTRRAMSLCPGG